MKKRFLLFLTILMVGFATEHPALSQNSKLRPATPSKNLVHPRETFAAAKKLFDAGSFAQALPQFEGILRQYPQFTPALVYYAKTLYRVDRIPESFQYFSRCDINTLDVTTSYEYGMAFFWMRQYEGALVAFRRVPAGHSLSDLANYYGGIAAMKMRFYADAEAMMEKAIVLPTKLAKSRALYLKHIKELKLLQEKEALAYERKMEKDRMQNAIKNANSAPPTTPPAKTKPSPGTSTAAQKNNEAPATKPADKPVEYEHQGFLKVEKGAFLEASYKSQNQDFHGYARKKSETQMTSFIFKGSKIFGFDPSSPQSKQSALGLELDLKADRTLTSGQERRNVVTDTDEDIQRIQISPPTKSITRAGSFALKPWLEFSLPEDVWIGMGGAVGYRYPDFEIKGRSGVYNGFVRAGRKLLPLSYSAMYNFVEITGEDNAPTMATHSASVVLNFAMDKFYIDATFAYDSIQYLDDTLDGPNSKAGASADNYVELPLGFYLGLFLSGQYQEENLVHNIPTYGEVSADGAVYTGKFYLIANPVSWFIAEINEQVQKSEWQVTPEAAQDTYERNQVDFLETFEAKASINLLF